MPEERKKAWNGVGIGIALGLPFGAVIGMLLFDNIAIGTALGLVFGLTIGAAVDARAAAPSDDETEERP